ncbi:hypothetical protein QUC31_003262 [Theobroma cacao]|uniref:Uncharacterized protein LOC18611316 n=2 Tax=Theobroma cacao TaxID=3641 RepID=A0AB32VJW9_THECC|nr:PREDICTED: uncharacterized protein LOC18611316 [Theobroma cacao]EOX91740.1 VQ motif-containing protein, putative [Theobroma cacao]WRX08353.1 VQ - like 1 [Theobroma cacao]
MEAYSSYSSSSSTLQEARGLKVAQPFHASLHEVRKPLAKPWKKPIAPLPPTPPRVYKVDPINFRDLVQKLTGAPEFMSQSQSSSQLQLPHHQRLQRVAPPPLSVASSPLSRAEVSAQLHLLSGFDHSAKTQNQKFLDNAKITSNSSLGLNLSPSSYNWCAFPILSPGTLSSLEQSTVP